MKQKQKMSEAGLTDCGKNRSSANAGDPVDIKRRKTLKSTAGVLLAGIAPPLLMTPGKAAAADSLNSANNRAAVVYFSRTGNTRFIAREIATQTGADLIEVKTVTPYPAAYRATTRQAEEELNANFRPEISLSADNFENYSHLFIGYPNWWGTMPMALFTLLEGHDFANKTLIPFCTHEGSSLGRSERDLRQLCPKSFFLEGHAQHGGDLDLVSAKQSKQSLQRWLLEIKMIA